MRQSGQAYRGPDRRRVGRATEGSVGWIRTISVVVLIATLGAAGWAFVFGDVVGLPTTGPGVATLRVAAAAVVVVVGLLLLRLAALAGTAAPRLVGVGALLLGAVAVAEIPAVVGDGAASVALRAAGMLPAVGLAAAAVAWPAVDTGLRTRRVLTVGVGTGAAVLGVVGAAMAAVPGGAGNLALSALVVAAATAAAGWLLAVALARRHRVLAVAGLLLLGWAVAELPLAVPTLTAATPALELLRLLAVTTVVVTVVDCLEAAFVAQRSALLRTEQDRAAVEQELQRRRDFEEERAHEANSALKSIDAASALLVRYHDSLGDGWQALSDGIRNEVQRLQHLVDSGSQSAEPETVDLAELVHAEAALARQAGTTVNVAVTEGIEAFAERQAVSSILHNLLDNARVHAPGAQVTIAADPPQPQDSEVELRVVDDGPGLPAGAGDELFARGWQGNGERGTGLGLYLARALAERGGGALWAADALGGGAAFVLRLPRSAVHERTDAVNQVGEVGDDHRLGIDGQPPGAVVERGERPGARRRRFVV